MNTCRISCSGGYNMRGKRIIKKDITHQDIGGKEFIIEMEVDKDDVAFKGLLGGNWACRNFIDRRPDFDCTFPYKLYYGKVGTLGYVLAEDEFEDSKCDVPKTAPKKHHSIPRLKASKELIDVLYR